MPLIRRKTGLVIDAYFSATKIAWLLKNVKGARALARQGKLAFGTMDTWLIWKLTGGTVHATPGASDNRGSDQQIKRGAHACAATRAHAAAPWRENGAAQVFFVM